MSLDILLSVIQLRTLHQQLEETVCHKDKLSKSTKYSKRILTRQVQLSAILLTITLPRYLPQIDQPLPKDDHET